MRVAIGGFFHESNTFSPLVTRAEDFLIFRREEIYAHQDAYLLAKGIISYFQAQAGYELVPLVFARAVPNGEVDAELYGRLKSEFFNYLQEAGPVDACVLALHGSMRVRGIGSAESDLLLALNSAFPGLPVFCGLDMHATVTRDLLRCSEALVGFKTAPHTDAWETGWQTARLADLALSTKTRLRMGAACLDCLIAGEKSETDFEPMRSLIAELREIEALPGVCSASLLLGFPWADAEENGVTALVVTQNDQALADACAHRIRDSFSARRGEFCFSVPAYPPEQALTLALRDTCKPVLVSDSGDNPTAGSTSDNTAVISLLANELKHLTRGKSITVAGIYDPEAVRVCAGRMGQRISLRVGGNFDTQYCQPLKLLGVPLRVVENFGLYAATLLLFQTEEFDLILTSKHIGFTDLEPFRVLEIDPFAQNVIVVKLGYLTPELQGIAAKAYLALTRGCTDEVLERLPYTRHYDLI